jgi:hypothetical protein
MSRRWVRLVALTVVASVAFSGLLVTVAEAKPVSYKFRGGSMYTLEFQSPGNPFAASTTRWGKISRSGKVTALSGDLGVENVIQAVFSAEDGLVYLVAALNDCTIWSFDPADPDDTITEEFVVDHPDVNNGFCASLAIVPETNSLVIGEFDSGNPATAGYGIYDPATGAWVADAEMLGGRGASVVDIHPTHDAMIEFSYAGYFTRSTTADGVEKKIRGRYTEIGSVRMDGAKTPWVLRTAQTSQYLGKFSIKSRKATWGKKLTDAETGLPWLTSSLIFIPGG